MYKLYNTFNNIYATQPINARYLPIKHGKHVWSIVLVCNCCS